MWGVIWRLWADGRARKGTLLLSRVRGMPFAHGTSHPPHLSDPPCSSCADAVEAADACLQSREDAHTHGRTHAGLKMHTKLWCPAHKRGGISLLASCCSAFLFFFCSPFAFLHATKKKQQRAVNQVGGVNERAAERDAHKVGGGVCVCVSPSKVKSCLGVRGRLTRRAQPPTREESKGGGGGERWCASGACVLGSLSLSRLSSPLPSPTQANGLFLGTATARKTSPPPCWKVGLHEYGKCGEVATPHHCFAPFAHIYVTASTLSPLFSLPPSLC